MALAVLELFVDQGGSSLQKPPSSASEALGLKVCTTVLSFIAIIISF